MQRETRGQSGLPRNLRKEPSTNANIRDAKGLSLELKAMLKSKDPWDREVEFQREALRKAYLHILFSPPVSSSHTSNNAPGNPPSSPLNATSPSHTSRLQDVLNLLWLDTSHALIHVYRSKVAEMEKVISEAPNAHRGKGRNGRGGPMPGGAGGARGNNIPGPTARRRLVQTFRTFLKQEEDFFRTLLSRLAVSLYPSDLAGLKSLGVSIPTPEEDDESGVLVTPSDEERKARRSSAVALAHKALICFGDLARYRELYNEPGAGAPSIGAVEGIPKERRATEKGKHGGGDRKLKNWTRAAECYHQARLLLPDNGNPSNQLAVLAQYSGDTISSTYHYYRALSVRFSFPTARTNLEITFSKAVSKWFSADGGEPDGDNGVKFKSAFVALHGMYFGKTRVGDILVLAARVEELFEISVRQRLLPSDIIVKAVVTSLCALWNARMFRSANKSSERNAGQSSESSLNFEPYILLHVLSFYRVLLSVGILETSELVNSNLASGVDSGDDLALNISAVLRRTLPAIRILSKWIMGQLEYITRVEARVEAKEKSSNVEVATGVALPDLQKNVASFWSAFARFSNSLRSHFPPGRLPSALEGGVWLEEDVDMLGFAPLRRGTKDGVGSTSTGVPVEIERVGKDVHPNEEQLMRIADIQGDAILVADSESSPLSYVDGAFIAEGIPLDFQSMSAVAEAGSPPLPPVEELQVEEEPEANYDDDGNSDDIISEDDDPVDLAMRLATADRMEREGEDDEDDDEEIVYPSLDSSQINASGTSTPATRKGSLLQPPPPPSVSSIQRNAPNLLQILNAPSLQGVSTSSLKTASPPLASRSIWAAAKATPTVFPTPHANSSESFEALPNITHRSLAPPSAQQAQHPSNALWPQPQFAQGSAPPPFYPQTTAPPALQGAGFGGFSPFHQPSRPLPVPASFAFQDPLAASNPFGRNPPLAHSDGWGVLGQHHNPPPQQPPLPQGQFFQHHPALQQQSYQQPHDYQPSSRQLPPPQFHPSQRP